MVQVRLGAAAVSAVVVAIEGCIGVGGGGWAGHTVGLLLTHNLYLWQAMEGKLLHAGLEGLGGRGATSSQMGGIRYW
jgi:hypothetical protein